MPRNACTRHPRKDVIEIPEGSRYCRRCHHLVPPEQEVTLEVKPEPSIETVKELAEASATPEVIGVLPEQPPEPELTEEIEAVEEAIEEAVEAEIEASVPEEKQPEETPVEAESEAIKETLDILEDASYDDLLPPETDKKAEIARLKALLATLEPETE